jgi:hypothetical protein
MFDSSVIRLQAVQVKGAHSTELTRYWQEKVFTPKTVAFANMIVESFTRAF